MKNATVELKNAQTQETQEVEVDPGDGKFAAVVKVEEDEDVVMTMKKKGFAFNSRTYSGSDTATMVNEGQVKMQEARVGEAYRINDIHYATNSARLTERSKFVLDEFLEYLKDNPGIRTAIHGHTDNVGTDEDNLALSQDRAFTVMSYLQDHGIDAGRLAFKGFGESKPVASNDTPEGRAENRRTEFVILSKE